MSNYLHKFDVDDNIMIRMSDKRALDIPKGEIVVEKKRKGFPIKNRDGFFWIPTYDIWIGNKRFEDTYIHNYRGKSEDIDSIINKYNAEQKGEEYILSEILKEIKKTNELLAKLLG